MRDSPNLCMPSSACLACALRIPQRQVSSHDAQVAVCCARHTTSGRLAALTAAPPQATACSKAAAAVAEHAWRPAEPRDSQPDALDRIAYCGRHNTCAALPRRCPEQDPAFSADMLRMAMMRAAADMYYPL